MNRQGDSTTQCPTCGLIVSKTLVKCPQDGTLLQQVLARGAFAERYEFLEALGTGGMSVIYKARQRALNRIVAIKMMHEHLMSGAAVRRFQQEGKAASALDHPNIVKVHDFGLTDQGQPYMVMDLVEGRSLGEVLDELGDLPTTQCLIIFIDICDALIHAHETGILHRDLKPSNIMLTTSPQRAMFAKLVDFGIAKIMDEDADSPMQKLTQTGELFGSPLYMSPEQCYGRKVDRRSDIYSFGCLMFECLTSKVPFRGDTLVDTISKQMSAKAPLLSQIRPDKTFPPRLEDVVDKCLAKNPDSRYRSMEELKAQLVSIQKEVDDGLLKEKTSLHRVMRTASEFKLAAILLVSSFLILGALAYAVSSYRNSHIEERKKFALEKAALLPYMDPEKISNFVLSQCLAEDAGKSELDLSGASITDDGMAYVALQHNLKDLTLDGTSITGKGLSYLKALPKLESLSITDAKSLTSEDLEALKNVPWLQELTVDRTKITGAAIKYLQPLKHLSLLNINHTKVSGPCLEPLSDLPLNTLNIGGTGLKASDLNSIKGLNHLTTLTMNESKMDDSAIEYLQRLKSLRDLSINNSTFTDGCAKYLAKMPLTKLNISATKLTDKGLPEIAKNKYLRELVMSYLTIDWRNISVLMNFPNLHSLDISSCDGINDEAVAEIAKNKSIRVLNLSANKDRKGENKLTPKVIEILAREMPQLTELRLDYTATIDEAALDQLSTLRNLKGLYLNGITVDDKERKNVKILKQRMIGCNVHNKK